jgi:epoxide hydrolase 4
MSEIAAIGFDLPAAGLQVHGLRAGASGSGVPRLVLLHGWPEWSHAWRPIMQRLAPRVEMVAPDLRGFGNTLPAVLSPGRDADAARHAQDLLELADQLGWDQFGIAAHDVGSFVAQAMVRRAPTRINGLFFFNCAYPGIGARWAAPRHLQEIWYQFFHQLPWAAELVGSSREACRIYLRHFLQHWSHQQAWIEPELEHWVDHFMQPGRLQGGFNWYGSVFAARLAVIEGRAPVDPAITTRTRVLWGAHDPVLKAEWTDRLHETFSDAQVNVLPAAGHFVHLEQPDIAAREIERFFCR